MNKVCQFLKITSKITMSEKPGTILYLSHSHGEGEGSQKVSKAAQPHLGATIIQYFYVGTESQVHDVYRHIITMGQIPQEVQHFVCHHTIFIIFCKTTYQLKQLFSLLFTCICPTGLENFFKMIWKQHIFIGHCLKLSLDKLYSSEKQHS